MLYQVIQSGWTHEIEAPSGCRVLETRPGHQALLIPGGLAGGDDEYLEPRVVVRAAKDHLFGLSRLRSRKVADGESLPSIIELGEQ